MGELAGRPLSGCHVLVVDADGGLAAALARASRATGAATDVAASADEALGVILAARPDALVAVGAVTEVAEVLAPLPASERPPLLAVTCAGDAPRASSATAVLVPPVTPGALLAAVAPIAPPAGRDDARRRALLRLSDAQVPGGDPLAALCTGLARAFGTDDALMWGGEGGDTWRASARPIAPGDATLARAALAASVAGTTLVLGASAPGGDGALLAAPLTSGRGARLGAVCLVSDRPRLYADAERRDLEAFASRLGREPA